MSLDLLAPDTTVRDIAARLPGAAQIFRDADISFCCGGALTLPQAAEKAGLDDDGWHAVYLEEEPDAFARFVEGLTEPDPEADATSGARGAVRVGLPEVMVARRNAVLAGAGEELSAMLARPTIQARCTTCPAPARLLRVEGEPPRWLRAANALFGG